MEEYITAVAETVSALLGERGLGQKIAEDVADCYKLDLLEELEAAVSVGLNNNETIAAAASAAAATTAEPAGVAGVLDILLRNIWHDERIYHRGMEELFLMLLRRRDLFFARNLVDSNGLQVLLQAMRRYPCNSAIQKHGARILQHVLDDSLSPYGVDIDDVEAVGVAGLLVAALKTHESRTCNNPRVAAQVQQAAIAAMSVRTPSGDTNREMIKRIAPAGGIPLLFSALNGAVHEISTVASDERNNHGRHYIDETQTQQAQLIGNCLFLLSSILTTASDPQSRRMFFHYARGNPNWRHPVEQIQNDQDLMLLVPGAELYLAVIRETLSDF